MGPEHIIGLAWPGNDKHIIFTIFQRSCLFVTSAISRRQRSSPDIHRMLVTTLRVTSIFGISGLSFSFYSRGHHAGVHWGQSQSPGMMCKGFLLWLPMLPPPIRFADTSIPITGCTLAYICHQLNLTFQFHLSELFKLRFSLLNRTYPTPAMNKFWFILPY